MKISEMWSRSVFLVAVLAAHLSARGDGLLVSSGESIVLGAPDVDELLLRLHYCRDEWKY